jgi:hypothetical protein
LEAEIKKFNADILERRAQMRFQPAATEEERIARTKAAKRRALDKVKAARAAARALRPVPSAEEMAAKAADRKARGKAARRAWRVRIRDERRAAKARRKALGLPSRVLQEPTVAGVQAQISRMLAPLRPRAVSSFVRPG